MLVLLRAGVLLSSYCCEQECCYVGIAASRSAAMLVLLRAGVLLCWYCCEQECGYVGIAAGRADQREKQWLGVEFYAHSILKVKGASV